MRKIRIKIVTLMIRKLLKLNNNQLFRFKNQKDVGRYYFTNDSLVKTFRNGNKRLANVSLNHLISQECEITKYNEYAH